MISQNYLTGGHFITDETILNSNCEKRIMEYLESILYCNFEKGELKFHSIPKLVFLWVIVITIEVFASIAIPSTLFIVGSIVSILGLLGGVFVYKKKDYRWFLFYAFNTSGVSLCVSVLFFGMSMNYGWQYMRIEIIFYFISIIVTGITTYKCRMNKIKKGWKVTKEDDKTKKVVIFAGAAMGVCCRHLMSDKLSNLIFLVLVAGLGTYFIATVLITYFYGKKYDPHGEIIHNLQSRYKENYNDKV